MRVFKDPCIIFNLQKYSLMHFICSVIEHLEAGYVILKGFIMEGRGSLVPGLFLSNLSASVFNA